jgi:hypothetical protein
LRNVVYLGMAERVGFDPVNAEPCTVLHDLVRAQETKYLSGFRLPLDFIDVFCKPIHAEVVALAQKKSTRLRLNMCPIPESSHFQPNFGPTHDVVAFSADRRFFSQ